MKGKISGQEVLARFAAALGGRLHQAIYFDDGDIAWDGTWGTNLVNAFMGPRLMVYGVRGQPTRTQETNP